MVSTIASLGILVSANVAPAMKSMDEVGGKVKDVGETSQKEGKKTEGVMKRWGSSFAAIGAAATASLYMIVKASPLLSGAIREAQDAINLLFMTIGDALEPVIRPFVDALWGLSDLVVDMPPPLNTLTAALIALGGSITAVLAGLTLLPTLLHAVGLGAGAAASGTLLLATSLFGIVTAAGLVAAALYYVSGDPTLAIVGALTTIGIGASILMHQPVVFAATSIISGFALLVTATSDLEIAAGVAFLAIGVAATALMGHPVVAAGVAAVGAFIAVEKATGDMELACIASFTAIGIGASILMSHPVIAAITAVISAIALLRKEWEWVERTFGKAGITEPESDVLKRLTRPWAAPGEYGWGFKSGGYVPYTGPAFLHAGEYVVPRGGGAAGAGGGYTDNRVFNFDIHDMLLAGDMDVERLKQRLDELYKRDMGMVA